MQDKNRLLAQALGLVRLQVLELAAFFPADAAKEAMRRLHAVLDELARLEKDVRCMPVPPVSEDVRTGGRRQIDYDP